jgi:branched-chain amino acid transport system permease protein
MAVSTKPAGSPRRELIPGENGKLIAFGVMFLAALSYPFWAAPLFGPANFSSLTSALNITLIYIMLAVGLNIVVGYAGLLDLGYAAFFAIGGYTMGFLTSNQSPLRGIFETNFWIALPISFLMAALFGVLLGLPVLGLKGDYLALVTLGFGEIVPITFNTLSALTRGDSGLAGMRQPNFFGIEFSATTLGNWYILAVIVVAFSIFLVRRLVRSRIGRAWMAMREDEIAASAMGINLIQTKLLAFGLGASFGGFAGAIFANSIGTANPSQFRYDVSIFILAMVILGGIGNTWGVIAGAILLMGADRVAIPWFTNTVRDFAQSLPLTTVTAADGTVSQQSFFVRDILLNIGTDSRLLIFGGILVFVMLIRPEGLFPSARRKAELHEHDEDAPADTTRQTAEDEKLQENLVERGDAPRYITPDMGDKNIEDKR